MKQLRKSKIGITDINMLPLVSIESATNSAINIDTIRSIILSCPTSFLPINLYTNIIKKYINIVLNIKLKYI